MVAIRRWLPDRAILAGWLFVCISCASSEAGAVCLPFGDAQADAIEEAALRDVGDPPKVLDEALAAARVKGDRLLEARLWAAAATRGIPRGNPGRVRDAIADELCRLVRDLVEHSHRAGAQALQVHVADTPDGQVALTIDLAPTALPAGKPGDEGLDLAVVEHRIRALGATLQVQGPGGGGVRVRALAPGIGPNPDSPDRGLPA